MDVQGITVADNQAASHRTHTGRAGKDQKINESSSMRRYSWMVGVVVRGGEIRRWSLRALEQARLLLTRLKGR